MMVTNSLHAYHHTLPSYEIFGEFLRKNKIQANELYNWDETGFQLGQLEKAEADCFFKQLMRGANYLHEMGIAHRDLKPENLFLTSNDCLKISDFGDAECFRLAWETDIHMSRTRRGSRPYVSPEQYLDQEFDPSSVDIWAAAMTYLVMRTDCEEPDDDPNCFGKMFDVASGNTVLVTQMFSMNSIRTNLFLVVSSDFGNEVSQNNTSDELTPSPLFFIG
ncbi:hypothetical protein DTO002I6_9667 [Penicillium roqueforti]|nr:hypothetical protein DTO002I6_9667 [Penicillium roqueforti]